MKYVVTAILHGVEMSEIPNGYAQPIIDGIKYNLSDTEKEYFIPVQINYSKNTQYKQMQMFGFCDNGLGKQNLRKAKYTVGGDLIMYQRTKSGEGFLADLHNQIDEAIKSKLNNNCIVLLLGHSLGTIVLYNHFFETKLTNKPVGIFMMGSPFSLYSLQYENWGGLPKDIQFMWNFYNPEDWISSQIQNVHPCKEIASFCQDFKVQPSLFSLDRITQKTVLFGGLRAHTGYWEDVNVSKRIADKIKSYILS